MNLDSQKQILLELKGKYEARLDGLQTRPIAHLTQWRKKNHYNRRLVEIERALVSVKDGSYGRCDSCERPITEERLSAMPFATKCFKCELA